MTGLFDVRIDREDGVVVIHAKEKPLLAAYRLEGEKLEEDELLRPATIEADLHTNLAFGRDDARTVERRVSGRGSRRARSRRVSRDTRVELVLAVEKVPTLLSSLDRRQRLTDAELRDVMHLKRLDDAHHGPRQTLTTSARRGSDSLRKLYRSRGFRDIRVGPVELDEALRIPIVEGRAIASMPHDRASLASQDEANDWLPSPGGIYDASALDAVTARVERHYQSLLSGNARRQAVAGGVRVMLRIDEGAFLRVGRILFRGNARHRDRDLRQQLVERDVGALTRLETIARVVPEIDFTARPGRVDITYHIEEVDPFEYLVGGGVNGVQGGTGNGQFIAKSLLGRGDMWRFNLDFGDRFQNFAVSYRDPSTLGHRLFYSVDFVRANLTYEDETSENTFDFAFRVGGPQSRKLQFLAGVRVVQFTLESALDDTVPFLTPFIGQRFRTYRTSATLAFESRDRQVFPTRGTGLSIGVELVTGDVEATHARAQLTELVRLGGSRRHVLALSGRVEAVWSFGATVADGLPRFERLFLGTENDMRGFAIRGVGPRDVNIVVGGDRLVFASGEYQFAPHPRVRLAGFFDMGNVYATDFDGLEMPKLRYDAAPSSNSSRRSGTFLSGSGTDSTWILYSTKVEGVSSSLSRYGSDEWLSRRVLLRKRRRHFCTRPLQRHDPPPAVDAGKVEMAHHFQPLQPERPRTQPTQHRRRANRSLRPPGRRVVPRAVGPARDAAENEPSAHGGRLRQPHRPRREPDGKR